MKMEWTTIPAGPIVLFLLPPDFSQPLTLEIKILDNLQQSQNAKSSTRNFAANGRYTLTMSALCGTANESTDIRMGCNRLKDEPIGVPLWMDGVTLSAAATSGGTSITFPAAKMPSRYSVNWIFINLVTFQYEVVLMSAITAGSLTAAAPLISTWLPGSYLCPLIFGRFTTRPIFTKFTDSINTVTFTLQEWSTLTNVLNPAPQAITTTTPANLGRANPEVLWDLNPTYSSDEEDSTIADIDYQTIGYNRLDAHFTYPQAPRRSLTLTYELCNRAQIARMEAYFINRSARAYNLWIPTFRDDVPMMHVTPNAPTNTLIVDGANRYIDTAFSTHPGYGYLCLNDNTGQAPVPVHLASIAGNVLTTTAAVTATFSLSAKLSAMILGRFTDSILTWTYDADGLADTQIKFTESTEDYLNIAYQQPVAHCYLFTYKVPTGFGTFLYTDYEAPLTLPGIGTFTPSWFSHGQIKTTLDISSDEVQITSYFFAGNPLTYFFPFVLEGEMWVDIYEVNRQVLGSPIKIFNGSIEQTQADGAKITATAKAFGSVFDQQFHRNVLASGCVYSVYSPAPECGVSQSNPAFYTDNTITIGSSTNTTIQVSSVRTAGLYTNGFAQIVAGPGGTQYRDVIYNSTTGATSNILLSRPFNGNIVGSTVRLFRGCDGTSKTCAQVFNNLLNFGGDENVPITNPSVQAVQPKDAQASTK